MAEPKPDTKSSPSAEELAAPPEELGLSRDARHSTYSEAPAPKDADDNPPPGPRVEQELGKPTEASE